MYGLFLSVNSFLFCETYVYDRKLSLYTDILFYVFMESDATVYVNDSTTSFFCLQFLVWSSKSNLETKKFLVMAGEKQSIFRLFIWIIVWFQAILIFLTCKLERP